MKHATIVEWIIWLLALAVMCLVFGSIWQKADLESPEPNDAISVVAFGAIDANDSVEATEKDLELLDYWDTTLGPNEIYVGTSYDEEAPERRAEDAVADAVIESLHRRPEALEQLARLVREGEELIGTESCLTATDVNFSTGAVTANVYPIETALGMVRNDPNAIRTLAEDGSICKVIGHHWRSGRPGESDGFMYADIHTGITYRTCTICDKCESQSTNDWE